MGVIGRVLAAVARAIRQVVWTIIDGVLRPVARTVDAVAGGVWNGLVQAFRRDATETEEATDDGRQAAADLATDQAIEAEVEPRMSIGQRLCRACELKRDGKAFEHLFDANDQHDRRLVKWVRCLEPQDLAGALRCSARTLERHTSPDDAWTTGLPHLAMPTDERRSRLLKAMADASESLPVAPTVEPDPKVVRARRLREERASDAAHAFFTARQRLAM